MSASDNGQRLAFPLHVEGWAVDLGLTKREWFAGLAMQGLLARNDTFPGDHRYVTGQAVRIADALLAELAKEPAP